MNDKVKNVQTQILSDNWYILKKVTYDFLKGDGTWQKQTREAYDRGNGACVLLYNKDLGNIILIKQFRLPTYINGNDDGMLIEVCAGLLDADNPEDCVRKESQEETGYKISDVRKVFEAYMSPGSVTEIVHFFVAEYNKEMRINEGGGLAHEQEDIEVLELKLDEALAMIATGEIRDGKTIMLLQWAKLHQLV